MRIDLLLILGLALAIGLMCLWWWLFLKTDKMGMVDVGWGFGLGSLAILYAVMADGRVSLRLIMAGFFAFHGYRLALFLWSRLRREDIDDPRYRALRAAWTTGFLAKAAGFFFGQALLQVVIALPFALIATRPEFVPALDVLAALIVVIGVLGELLADRQLDRFKRTCERGAVCDVGLWRYSRHPNYFFEWLIWIGAAVAAVPATWGWLGMIAPIAMFVFLFFVTGVPPAEARALQSRGQAYRDYQSRTSVFIPLPPNS